jgi:hypothetical protein
LSSPALPKKGNLINGATICIGLDPSYILDGAMRAFDTRSVRVV